jgi:coproporphyrinogen III oxidase, anaerobic (EC 1.3.99.22)
MQTVEKYFRLEADQEGDYSIEIHPKGVTSERLAHLRAIGFNRLSMGVQDFDPGVQKAVNRFNSFDEVKELIDTARSLQFRSLNIDLIYGLPQQTPASFANTLEKIIELRPDRLSVFNYAHMPELFKTQAQINESDLPSGRDKLIILQQTIQQLIGAGYVYVGMDHFALPNDELAIAQQQGNLHRNFQGYTTRGNCDLFAFGVSSIAAFGDSYIQNLKTLDAYYTALEHDQLPLAKGITLSDDDKIRRYIIGQLMCHFELDFASVGKHTGIKFRQYFKHELIAIQQLVDDGLILLNSERLKVLPQGRLLIRRVCMMFDTYLNANPNQRSDTLVPVKQLTGETPNNAQANSAPGKSFSKII